MRVEDDQTAGRLGGNATRATAVTASGYATPVTSVKHTSSTNAGRSVENKSVPLT